MREAVGRKSEAHSAIRCFAPSYADVGVSPQPGSRSHLLFYRKPVWPPFWPAHWHSEYPWGEAAALLEQV